VVYLVKKIGGIDDGVQYAMNVMNKMQIILNDLREEVMEERDIMKDVTKSPILNGTQVCLSNVRQTELYTE
jgi:hypothetical protein